MRYGSSAHPERSRRTSASEQLDPQSVRTNFDHLKSILLGQVLVYSADTQNRKSPMMLRALSLAALMIALPACTQESAAPADNPGFPPTSEMPGPAEGVYPSMMRATATMISKDGDEIGSANILGGPSGILIRIELGPGSLTPGWHGLHLHGKGTCEDTGVFKASGGHVGKSEGGHGLLNHKGPEAGDLPNIWAGADGAAGYEALTTLTDMASLVTGDGAAIIIHASEDDHMGQPIGGAGARVSCGVIG